MARIRTIKPEFFDDPDVNSLSPLAALLFAGLFTQADRRGRMVDEPMRLKYRLMPGRNVNVNELLDELHTAKMVIRYEVDGRKLLCVRTFERHQQPHPREAESVLPAPPETDKDMPGPEKAMSSREKVVPSNAVSDPVSGSGNGDGVGKGAQLAPLARVASLMDRSHRSHAQCGRMCVPAALHQELRRIVGGDEQAADDQLRAWYSAELEAISDGPIDEPDAFRFWRERFKAWRAGPSSRARPLASADAFGWCEHEPRCGTMAGHQLRLQRESRTVEPAACRA